MKHKKNIKKTVTKKAVVVHKPLFETKHTPSGKWAAHNERIAQLLRKQYGVETPTVKSPTARKHLVSNFANPEVQQKALEARREKKRLRILKKAQREEYAQKNGIFLTSFYVNADLHQAFKDKCQMVGESKTSVLNNLMLEWVTSPIKTKVV